MGPDQDDGVYLPDQRRVQRRKKAGVAIAGLAAILGGASYAVTTWFTGEDATAPGDTGALAPIVTPTSRRPHAAPQTTAEPTETVRRMPPRIAGVRQRSLPSPTPSTAALPDDEVASTQVSRLLGAPRTTPSGGLVAADEAITVVHEAGSDGSSIQVVSARFDLTGRGSHLWAADDGLPISGARCTQNLRVEGEPAARVRPNVMLCWRASTARSVVTVATSPVGRPAAAISAAVIDRAWQRLG
ncbi:MAG TPA: hypothetical protein VGB74_20740 [Actinoplanes sp.]|jgi:hypothetical protein